VNRAHPDAEFASAVSALARELARGPRSRSAALLFQQSTQESLETQMELEAIAACEHTISGTPCGVATPSQGPLVGC
jgi:hypothetical protein